MSGVYFASDLHLGHKNIIKFREFETVENHDKFVFEKIMEVSGKRSSLYLLGDTCFHKDSFHYIKKIKEAFNKVTMVIGNHDFERSDSPSQRDYLDLDIPLYGMLKYKEFWLTHAPIFIDELRGRHNIHGHTHHNSYDSIYHTNVSLENIGYSPLNLDILREELKHRPKNGGYVCRKGL